MLENGTVINGKMIERPKTFRTACTIATQIIAQVASGQFGGQTITLGHLAPFVRISKEKFIRDTRREWDKMGFAYTEEQLMEAVKAKLEEEVRGGIQTFQYQINTLQTSNGQAPFLSVFMYINEYPEYEEETVFPYINSLCNDTLEKKFSIHEFKSNHSNIEDKLDDLMNILIKYLPADIFPKERIEISIDIMNLSSDLSCHTLVEERVLVPFVELLERKCYENK